MRNDRSVEKVLSAVCTESRRAEGTCGHGAVSGMYF